MFHTYIVAHSGNEVDFDRASFLMDEELLDQSIRAMKYERDSQPRPDTTYGAQWVWDRYCGLHQERYGTGFVPNVNPVGIASENQRGSSNRPYQSRDTFSCFTPTFSQQAERSSILTGRRL